MKRIFKQLLLCVVVMCVYTFVSVIVTDLTGKDLYGWFMFMAGMTYMGIKV